MDHTQQQGGHIHKDNTYIATVITDNQLLYLSLHMGGWSITRTLVFVLLTVLLCKWSDSKRTKLFYSRLFYIDNNCNHTENDNLMPPKNWPNSLDKNWISFHPLHARLKSVILLTAVY